MEQTIPFDLEKFNAGWKLVHPDGSIERTRDKESPCKYNIGWEDGLITVELIVDCLNGDFRLLPPSTEKVGFDVWWRDNKQNVMQIRFTVGETESYQAAYEAGKNSSK